MSPVTFSSQKHTFSQARRELDSLLHHQTTNWAVKITFFLLGAGWLILVWFWSRLPPEVPLLYSRPWGEEQLVNKPLILLLPALSTFFTLTNLRLASLFFDKEKFFSQLIIWLNLVVVALAITTMIRILLIIT